MKHAQSDVGKVSVAMQSAELKLYRAGGMWGLDELTPAILYILQDMATFCVDVDPITYYNRQLAQHGTTWARISQIPTTRYVIFCEFMRYIAKFRRGDDAVAFVHRHMNELGFF